MSYQSLPPLDQWERRKNGDRIHTTDHSGLLYPITARQDYDCTPVRSRREFTIKKANQGWQVKIAAEEGDLNQIEEGKIYPSEEAAYSALNEFVPRQLVQEFMEHAECVVDKLGYRLEWKVKRVMRT